jgi:hypothetical protein
MQPNMRFLQTVSAGLSLAAESPER